jgi:probable phosphomutase (TIGR03848 family)
MLPRMALMLLIRHAVTEDTGKRLYGRRPGVHLSERGRRQAASLADRLRGLPVASVYCSPLERCVETAEPIAEALGLTARIDRGLLETDLGEWTGRTFGQLRRARAWRRLLTLPSVTRFPGGESLPEVQARVVRSLAEIAERHPRSLVVVVSHGDPIRLALAHYLGLALDLSGRLHVPPGCVSAVALGDGPPSILRVGDTGTLEDLVRREPRGW